MRTILDTYTRITGEPVPAGAIITVEEADIWLRTLEEPLSPGTEWEIIASAGVDAGDCDLCSEELPTTSETDSWDRYAHRQIHAEGYRLTIADHDPLMICEHCADKFQAFVDRRFRRRSLAKFVGTNREFADFIRTLSKRVLPIRIDALSA